MFLGLITGNMMLIYLGFIPVVFVAVGLLLPNPDKITVHDPRELEEYYVDDSVQLKREITVETGIGPVFIYEEIPIEFKIPEGTNLNIYWKGIGVMKTSYVNQITCTRRGAYTIGEMQTKGLHTLDLHSPITQNHDLNQELIVKPRPSRVKRVRRRRQTSLFPIPSESRIKFGVQTSDFKEIREYNYGDPYKSINWKATSRLNTVRNAKPAVNEYEREGRRVTWIFLDTAMRLNLGNSIRNSFEYAVQATTSLADYYIKRQCMVGFAEYTTKPTSKIPYPWFGVSLISNKDPYKELTERGMNVIFPEAGPIQLYKIQRRLLAVETTSIGLDLIQVVRQSRGHIYGTNPLFIIITNVNQNNIQPLRDSIKELSKYTLRIRTQRTNIMIISVSGYQLASQTDYQAMATRALRFEERELSKELSFPGVTVINWDPSKQNIVQVMLATVRQK
jgi:uncharacterized protein (DUF58 family)